MNGFTSNLLLEEERLRVAVVLQATSTPLPANATLFVSPKWHRGRNINVCIDPDAAGLKTPADALSFVKIR